MKKLAFLVSHYCSGSSILKNILEDNPRVQAVDLGIYEHPTDLELLNNIRHKDGSTASWFVDELLENAALRHKAFYDFCKFIYIVREPLATLNALVVEKKYSMVRACRYYCFRLRRICEMARRTPGAVLLTWDDMVTGRGLPLVRSYLRLKQPLVSNPALFEESHRDVVSLGVVEEAERSYERHLFYLRSLPLAYFSV